MLFDSHQRYNFVDVYFEFLKHKHYRELTTLRPAAILLYIERKFIRNLGAAYDRAVREVANTSYVLDWLYSTCFLA